VPGEPGVDMCNLVCLSLDGPQSGCTLEGGSVSHALLRAMLILKLCGDGVESGSNSLAGPRADMLPLLFVNEGPKFLDVTELFKAG
jgi:hypothetical protein